MKVQCSRPRAGLFIVISFVCLLACEFVRAGSATWNLDPTSGDWNTAANWTPATVPSHSADVATFDASNLTEVTVSVYLTEPGQIIFNPGASAFTITSLPTTSLDLVGSGIINNSGIEQNFVIAADEIGNTGEMVFINQATVGDLVTFTVNPRPRNGGIAYSIQFQGDSSAGGGKFINQGATTSGGLGGVTYFFDKSTAADATLICEGALVRGAAGGLVIFHDSSRIENSTLIAQGGTNGGAGGIIQLQDNSVHDAGTGRVEVFGNGSLDMRAHLNTSDGVRIGSLEGDGLVFIGRKSFSVGNNSLDTTFSGVIEDNGVDAPGTLRKIGEGTLTLAGVNSYNGGTFVKAGTLRITTTSGSGSGPGPVTVDAGTLGGSGTIAGVVTVGTGSGTGAFLTPGIGTNRQITLTIQSALTLNAEATYTYTFKGNQKRVRTDLVSADGVTINGATFAISSTGQNQLKRGTVLTAISNTSANPISGAFANLPDGGIINVNGNTLQASYTGGDGNDLTLTVVQ